MTKGVYKRTKEHIIKAGKASGLARLGKPHKGHKLSEVTKEKIRNKRIGKTCGEEHYNWKGGITPINIKIRGSVEYKLWRKSVFERDDYTCVWCGIKSVKGAFVLLQADHIKPFAYFPELRFAIDNGRTLCVPCHKTTDTFAYKAIKNYGKQ